MVCRPAGASITFGIEFTVIDAVATSPCTPPAIFMVNAGEPGVEVDADGWTARTRDGSLSAHFEYSVAVTEDGARVLGR